MNSPCLKCFAHGITYSKDDCKDCEFNVVTNMLKQIVFQNDNCFMCKHSATVQGGFYDCDKEDITCKDHNLYELDYAKVIKEYNIKL